MPHYDNDLGVVIWNDRDPDDEKDERDARRAEELELTAAELVAEHTGREIVEAAQRENPRRLDA